MNFSPNGRGPGEDQRTHGSRPVTSNRNASCQRDRGLGARQRGGG